jgi:ketosteroid isomerase-like protein
MRRTVVALLVLLAAISLPAIAEPLDELREQVRQREVAFAQTMADRDHEAFQTFLAEDAIFLSGSKALRGKEAVAAAWKGFFEKPDAPFSWTPETVEVVASGTLAISTGPVFAPDGSRVGTFNSTWRKEPDGSWKVVLDNGCPPCDCGSVDEGDS